jgi:hypothetical protein
MKQIEVLIKKDGSIVVETKGYKGHECVEASAALEEALGTIEDVSFTEEMYQETQNVEQINQK